MALINELRKQGDFLFKYRSTLPLVILLPALALFLYYQFYGTGIDTDTERTLRYCGLFSAILGLAIRSHVIGHVAPNTSGRNTDIGQKADVLNSTGLYSVVRHPLYVGNFFMWLGPALWTMNFWFILFFIAAYYLYYERIMYAEERFLEEKFGKDYMDWAAGRPAFIPRMSGYVSAPKEFNWRKVIRQERSGLLATFLIFWLFDVLGRGVSSGWDTALVWNFWSKAFVVVLVIFLILKGLKHSKFLKDR